MNLGGVLFIGLLITLFFGGIGYLLKKVIWNSKKDVLTNIDSGRKFASIFVFYSAFGAGHFFAKANIVEAIAQTIITIVFFGLIGFVTGYLYRDVIKNKNWKPISLVIISIIVIVIANDSNEEFNGLNETDFDMHFSTKFALLYALAGFVANAYYIKEGENAKNVLIGGLLLCSLITFSSYGLNYALLTAVEYAIGAGIAHIILNKKEDTETENKD